MDGVPTAPQKRLSQALAPHLNHPERAIDEVSQWWREHARHRPKPPSLLPAIVRAALDRCAGRPDWAARTIDQALSEQSGS